MELVPCLRRLRESQHDLLRAQARAESHVRGGLREHRVTVLRSQADAHRAGDWT